MNLHRSFGSCKGHGVFDGIEVEMVVMTPIAAEALLRRTEQLGFLNRDVRESRIERYRFDMPDGWLINGETISISKEGAVLNGQHRLQALCETGCDVPMIVVRGVDRDAFKTFDQALVRRAGDIAKQLGEVNCHHLAAAVRLVHMYDQGGFNSWQGGVTFTNSAFVSSLKEYPGIRGSVLRSAGCKAGTPSSAVAAAMHHLFERKDKRMADWFIDRLADGVNISAEDPVYLLRERLRAVKIAPGRSLTILAQVYLYVRTWNAMRAGEPLRKLMLPKDRITVPEII